MKNVLEWLERSALVRPEKIAFADEASELTFSELREGAEKIGTVLAGKTKPRRPVSFYLEKSTIAIQGMFGAVYAGAFYSLLDTRQPEGRLGKILEILNPSVILTDRANEDKAGKLFGEGSAEILVIEDLLAEAEADESLLKAIREKALDIDPLYVNFTSGSTGTPKGVAVSHRSVIDFIEPFTELFGITEQDVIGNQAPFDFDVSVKDIFSGLCTGASVQIIPRTYFSFPTKLMDFLADRQVTTLIWAVSAMCFVSIMNGFDYRVPEKVNKVMFSGEVMPVKQLNIWKQFLPDAVYVNLYGPTEITCNCTYYVLDREYADGDSIPIGKAFPNEQVFLLDENDEAVTEPGMPGEICVSGTTLALGYYKNPERTAEAFMQNPLNDAYPELIYRTGDLGRMDENGNLIYISRKDFQIKHMGHRIELGEIETTAQALEGVSRACCLYDREKKRLLLFYTGEAEKKIVSRSLRKQLPPFMIPNAVTALPEMPMTKNGKIDRAVLKEMGGIS
ncbi:MAG: amino acid adenylation domain-containing protein [Lachnospiraceae bacterium]|nr:amino acid adenylation domain-containing protein [Lachnospiraceae bacterium]